jgi:dynein heavy chain 1
MRADTAMNTINIFEGKLNRVQEEYDLVCRAKEALDLELMRHTRLEPVFEELRDLKAVWTALSGVWSQIGELREIPWATVQPRKLRQQIDGLLTSTREMPARMRQYSAFEYVQEQLRGLLKSNILVSELKSDALKERHWRQLFKVLKLPTQPTLSL